MHAHGPAALSSLRVSHLTSLNIYRGLSQYSSELTLCPSVKVKHGLVLTKTSSTPGSNCWHSHGPCCFMVQQLTYQGIKYDGPYLPPLDLSAILIMPLGDTHSCMYIFVKARDRSTDLPMSQCTITACCHAVFLLAIFLSKHCIAPCSLSLREL